MDAALQSSTINWSWNEGPFRNLGLPLSGEADDSNRAQEPFMPNLHPSRFAVTGGWGRSKFPSIGEPCARYDSADDDIAAAWTDGMTPTPSKTADQLDSHSDCMTDSHPDYDFPTPTFRDGESWIAGIPTFQTPEDAAAYLRQGRPDLDQELQRSLRQYEAQSRRQEELSAWQRESMLSEDHRLISLQALVGEAARIAFRRMNKRNDGLFGPTPATLKDGWSDIRNAVRDDFFREGYLVPQRNLSCMCMFAPQRPGCATPLPSPYGDNETERHQRAARQVQILRAVNNQHLIGEQSLFLRNPGCSLKSTHEDPADWFEPIHEFS